MDEHEGPNGEYSVHSAEEKKKVHFRRMWRKRFVLLFFIAILSLVVWIYTSQWEKIFTKSLHWIAWGSTITIGAGIIIFVFTFIYDAFKSQKSHRERYLYHRGNCQKITPKKRDGVHIPVLNIQISKAAR